MQDVASQLRRAHDETLPRAIVRQGGRILCVERRRAGLGPCEVRIAVRCVGLCRTDVFVATGRIACEEPRVLGHEVSGVVLARGTQVHDLALGARVTVFPFVRCADCVGCRGGSPCRAPRRLGVEVDGAFSDELVVPADVVVPVPDALSFRHAAYVEPVAAALAVLHVGLEPSVPGAIVGRGRIAELTHRALKASGFARVSVVEPGSRDGAEHAWVIETDGTGASVETALSLLAPRGTLVVKSRPAGTVPVRLGELVRRELTLRTAAYAPFSEAITLLASGELEVGDLLGPVRPLETLPSFLTGEREDESLKLFFAPAPELALDRPARGASPCAE